MCLVALAWKCHPRWRLLLAGNRDEFHARPTAALARWQPATTAPAVYAGRDLLSGGSWAGLDVRGRCAVVTNVRAPAAPLVTGSSRGELLVHFLSTDQEPALQAGALRAARTVYAPFNLLIADATRCFYVGNHPAGMQAELAPGIHGMSNGGFGLPWPKTLRLERAMQAWVESETDDLAPMWTALADETIAADADLPDTGVGLALDEGYRPPSSAAPTTAPAPAPSSPSTTGAKGGSANAVSAPMGCSKARPRCATTIDRTRS